MRQRTRGIALVVTLSILVVISLLIFGALFTTQTQAYNTRNDISTTQAEYVARAGLQKYKTAAFQAFRYYIDPTNSGTYATAASRYAQCGNLLSLGIDSNRNGIFDSSEGDLTNSNGTSWETLSDADGNEVGSFRVEYFVDGQTVILRSTGKTSGLFGGKATAQLVLQGQNSGVFANAIFAGNGAANRFINGGANIWGSVYVQGDSTQPNANVINSNGNFTMRNYYSSAQLAEATRLTSSQLNSYLKLQATEQKDMCARLRVAYGKVELSGSSLVGEATADTGYQPKVQGVNVGTGTATTSGSAQINSQTAVSSYDLSAPISFPTLDGNFCSTSTLLTWRQCIQSEISTGKGISISMVGGVPVVTPSTVTCSPSSALSSIVSRISNRDTLTFGTTSISCLSPDGTQGFTYVYNNSTSTGELTVKGMLNLKGIDAWFKEDMIVRYDGKSTLFVEKSGNAGGNVTVDGNVLPGGGGSGTFPDSDVLGVLAENDITFTGDNQNGLATTKQVAIGLFYAGNQATVSKDSTLMGNLTADTFCTSSNCNAGQGPSIIQVPGLEYNLPPAFDRLNNSTLATFRILAYERR